MSRRFTAASSEWLRCSLGGCNLNGAYTLAWLTRRATAGTWQCMLSTRKSADTPGVTMEFTTGTNLVEVGRDDAAWIDSTAAFSSTTDWYIIVVTKASGTATPRLHYYNVTAGGSWTHQNYASTIADAGSQAGGSIVWGQYKAAAPDYFNGWLAVTALWAGTALSDAQCAELSTNLQTSDWWNNTGGDPSGLWEWNGTVAAGLVDLAPGNADQTAVTGTTQDTGTDPPGWTYDGVGGGASVDLTAATETDAAQALSWSGGADVPGYGTGTYGSGTYGDLNDSGVELTPALETDIAVALTVTKPIVKTLTPALETDAAQALSITHVHLRSLIAALTTDTAQPLFADKAPTLVAATETNAAQGLSVTKAILKDLTVATETDQAQPLTATKTIFKNLTTATELDAAQALTATKTIFTNLVHASETDTAEAVTYSQAGAVDILPATETDSAQPLVVEKVIFISLAPALETATAVALTFTQAASYSITPALEVDTAQPLVVTHVHYVTVTPATESDLAVALLYSGLVVPRSNLPTVLLLNDYRTMLVLDG